MRSCWQEVVRLLHRSELRCCSRHRSLSRPASSTPTSTPTTAAAGATATAAGTTAYRGHTPNCADQIATARNALANAFRSASSAVCSRSQESSMDFASSGVQRQEACSESFLAGGQGCQIPTDGTSSRGITDVSTLVRSITPRRIIRRYDFEEIEVS